MKPSAPRRASSFSPRPFSASSACPTSPPARSGTTTRTSRVTRNAVSAGARLGALAITSTTLAPGSSGTATVKLPPLTLAGRPSTRTCAVAGSTVPRTATVPDWTVAVSPGCWIVSATSRCGSGGGLSRPPQPATTATAGQQAAMRGPARMPDQATVPPASARRRGAALDRRDRRSDVIHGRAGLAILALDDVSDRRPCEHLPGGLSRVREQTLGPGADRAVEQLDELDDRDLRGIAGERVAALDAALGLEDAGPAQDGEELLEELDRDVAPAGQLADRHRAAAGEAGELDERAQRVGRLGGDRDHAATDRRRVGGGAAGSQPRSTPIRRSPASIL